MSDSFTSLSHQAAIALGSNLGDSHAILRGALHMLRDSPGIRLEAYSRWYQTPAVGPPQPDYLNACAIVSTRLSPRGLLHRLLDIEASFGRERRERWGPRTLDLDLLLFNNEVVNEPGLILPHPCMTERAFVLVPLCDIAPDWIHPVQKRAIAQLVQQVDCSGISPVLSTEPWRRETDPVAQSINNK